VTEFNHNSLIVSLKPVANINVR